MYLSLLVKYNCWWEGYNISIINKSVKCKFLSFSDKVSSVWHKAAYGLRRGGGSHKGLLSNLLFHSIITSLCFVCKLLTDLTPLQKAQTTLYWVNFLFLALVLIKSMHSSSIIFNQKLTENQVIDISVSFFSGDHAQFIKGFLARCRCYLQES